MVLPGEVAVASGTIHAPHHAAFAVHQRRVRLPVFADEIERGTRIRFLHHFADVVAHDLIAVEIEVPGV